MVVKDLWKRAVADDFAFLLTFPSTEARNCVRYLRGLPAPARDEFMSICVLFGARSLLPSGGVTILEDEKETWLRHRQAILAHDTGTWFDSIGVRELKRIASAARAGMTSIKLPEEVEARAGALSVPKAPELRKLVRRHVAEPLGLKPRNDGGGDWDYHQVPDSGVLLNIDYGGMVAQLRYSVLRRVSGEILPRRLSYERLLGIGEGDWDLITSDNAVTALELLQGVVRDLFVLAAGIQPGHAGSSDA